MQGCAEMSLRQYYAHCLIGTGSGGLKINDELSTFLSQLSLSQQSSHVTKFLST